MLRTLFNGRQQYLNGARFRTPDADKDETKAMGRGITALVRSLYISLHGFLSETEARKDRMTRTVYP
jgi:hypothetical protein